MDTSNRLLAMLNSATSASPPPPSHPNPNAAAPSPPPPPPAQSPPPSLQAVSLQDLFKGLSLPTQPAPAPAGQQDKLLGMLKGLGGGGSGSGSGSGMGTPSGPGVKSPEQPAHPNPPLPVHQPLLSHATATPPPPTPPPPPAAATSPPAPTVPSPAPATSPPAQKSMFDFVSPFAVFEAPKPSPKPQTTVVEDIKPDVRAMEAAKPPVVQEKEGSDSKSAGAEREGMPYLIRNMLQPGQEGSGPKTLEPHTVVDQSRLNIDGLMTAPDSVEITPMATRKGDQVAFSQGRTIGMTPGWIAYALSKGRIRSIDSTSGCRLLLQVPSPSSSASVVDMAVTPTRVAVVSSDSSVTAFAVPSEWTKDDPACEVLLHLGPGRGLGKVKQVEWVRKDGKDWLAVGGEQGVILVNPEEIGSQTSMDEMVRGAKVLTTDGPLVAFCLNHSHQAIGLLSASSIFTLYNVQTLNRVWHRPLPSLSPSRPPSSVQFCESNILVGREQNTLLELVQITVDLAVLSTIRFDAPQATANFAQVSYDASTSVLWVAPVARGSVFAFKYALKGPVSGVDKERGVRGFEKMVEVPLEPVLEMVLPRGSRTAEEGDSVDMFFSSPSGLSLAAIGKHVLEALGKSGAAIGEKETSTGKAAGEQVGNGAGGGGGKKGNKGGLGNTPKGTPKGKTDSKLPSPAQVKVELPDEPAATAAASPSKEPEPAARAAVPDPTVSSGLSVDDVNKALKKTEDRLSNHLKQLMLNHQTSLTARLDADDLVNKVEKRVGSAVQAEVKKALGPAVEKEVKAGLPRAVQGLEKGLIRGLEEAVNAAVGPTVQRAVAEALGPALAGVGERIGSQLSREIKSEFLQIRKELSPPSTAASDTLLKTMAQSLADLQRQVERLTERLESPPAPRQNSHTNGPAPPLPLVPAVSPAPALAPAPTRPSPVQLEEAFLSALGASSTPATLALVHEYYPLTDYLFPFSPPPPPSSHHQQPSSSSTRSPLSAPVILTLLHRLAVALSELPPTDPAFVRVATWEGRVARVIDSREASTAAFFPRVVGVVQALLGQVVAGLGSARWAGVEGGREMRALVAGVLDEVGRKGMGMGISGA